MPKRGLIVVCQHKRTRRTRRDDVMPSRPYKHKTPTLQCHNRAAVVFDSGFGSRCHRRRRRRRHRRTFNPPLHTTAAAAASSIRALGRQILMQLSAHTNLSIRTAYRAARSSKRYSACIRAVSYMVRSDMRNAHTTAVRATNDTKQRSNWRLGRFGGIFDCCDVVVVVADNDVVVDCARTIFRPAARSKLTTFVM